MKTTLLLLLSAVSLSAFDFPRSFRFCPPPPPPPPKVQSLTLRMALWVWYGEAANELTYTTDANARAILERTMFEYLLLLKSASPSDLDKPFVGDVFKK